VARTITPSFAAGNRGRKAEGKNHRTWLESEKTRLGRIYKKIIKKKNGLTTNQAVRF
jgi:hypothetical protein